MQYYSCLLLQTDSFLKKEDQGVQISGNKKLQRLKKGNPTAYTGVRWKTVEREWRGREIHSAFVARTDFWQPFNDPPDVAHRFHPRCCCLFPCFPPLPPRLLASPFHSLVVSLLLLPYGRSRHGVVRRAPPRHAG
jgi:hypothetical protein